MKPIKTIFVAAGLLIATQTLVASAAPASLTDVPYTFDPAKVSESADAFHFLRSFVPYYYLLFKGNQSNLPLITSLTNQAGWCAGDAHPENFGALLQVNDKSVFAVNDVDDAGPCPIVLDIARLMVSSRLYDDSIDLSDALKAYRHGLDGKSFDMPDVVDQLLSDSENKGEAPKKSKVDQGKLIRDAQSVEVSAQIKTEIAAKIKSVLPNHADVIDVFQTAKVGGGSGGLRRYEILVQDKKDLIQLELKQEVEPSIASVATAPIPALAERLAKTLAVEQGDQVSTYYTAVTVDGLSMMLRPRFGGNKGVSLADNKQKDNVDLIVYEAYILGRTHAASIGAAAAGKWSDRLKAIDMTELEREVTLIDQAFTQKFKALSGT